MPNPVTPISPSLRRRATGVLAPDVATQVQTLLAQSRAAHLEKKHAAGKADKSGRVTSHPNYPKAEAHIRQALELREQADALDPDHVAEAWIEDQAANRGRSSAELLEFFRYYLTIP